MVNERTLGFLQSPLRRLLTGALFLILGLVLYAVGQYQNEIFGLFCESDEGFWCGAMRLAIIDLGINGVAYILVILGVILLVLFDFVAEVFGYMLTFALNHIANSSKVVIDAMEKGRVSKDESAEIISQTIARHKGYLDEKSKSFADFLVENLIEQNSKDGGFWRTDYRVNIEVREPMDAAFADKKLYRWDETNKFIVWSETGSGTYEYSSGSTTEVSSLDDALLVVQHMKYEVACNGQIEFSFEDIRGKITKDVLQKDAGFSESGISISYKNGLLNLMVEKSIAITERETDIVVDEESFLFDEDRTFELTFFEPTKGVNFRLSLPDSMTIVHYGASGQRFGSRDTNKVMLKLPRPNQLRIDTSTWVLPGTFTALAWKET